MNPLSSRVLRFAARMSPAPLANQSALRQLEIVPLISTIAWVRRRALLAGLPAALLATREVLPHIC